jgi:beta-N-acetylhexosaminidase
MPRRAASPIWGFSVNFAPVVDLDLNPDNQVIGKFGRSFGKSGANTVTVYAEQVIAAHHEAGVLTALKHYPGHGSSTADSHEGYVDITRTWSDIELEPYRQLIGSGYADFVMVGHLIDTEIDASGVKPSSLSRVWINDTLRNSLGFKGVVITDDLEMGAIRDHYGLEETVVRAVNAGVDVLLFSNTVKPRTSLGDEVRAILVKEAEGRSGLPGAHRGKLPAHRRPEDPDSAGSFRAGSGFSPSRVAEAKKLPSTPKSASLALQQGSNRASQ